MVRHAVPGILIGLAASGLCLWYAYRGVDLSAMAGAVGRVGAIWVMASVVAALGSLVLRGIRWRYLLPNGAAAPLPSLVSATFIGIMANNLLPARLGEVVRAWIFARNEERPVTGVFASIVLERMIDLITLGAVLSVALFVSPPLSGSRSVKLQSVGLVGVVISLILIVGLVMMVRFEHRIHRAVTRLAMKQHPTWLRRGIELFDGFIEGLCVLRGRTQIFHAVWLSLLIWCVGIASFHVLAEGFGLGLTGSQSALVFVVVVFGIAVPSAPGFIGTFHGFCVAGLALVAGTDRTSAAAYATLLHGSQWLSVNIVGLGLLAMDRTMATSAMIGLRRRA